MAPLLCGLYLVAGTNWIWLPLWSWWTLISVFAGLVLATVRGAPWTGVAVAAVFAFVVVFMVAAGVGPYDDTYDHDNSRLSQYGRVMHRMIAAILDAPDMPAESWSAAQRQLERDRSVTLIEPEVPLPVSRWLAGVTDCDQLPAEPNKDYPPDHLGRIRAVCQQIAAGAGSGWTRSALVILFFSVGLVAASVLERRWRPAEYLGHKIQMYDRLLLCGLGACVVLGALVVRLTA